MKGSHDSLTSYRLKNWWLYPIIWTARTQNLNLESQFKKGVRYFDLRFRNVGGKLYAAHGFFIFDITIEEVFDKMRGMKDMVWCRILHEDQLVKDDIEFDEFVKMIPIIPCNVNIDWIGRKSKWQIGKVKMYGRNDFKIGDIDEKQEEIFDNVYPKEPYVYECYSYKMIPLYSKMIRAPYDSMTNFV